MPAISEVKGGCLLKVKVFPGRGKFEITKVEDAQIRISLKSQPEGGKANSELLRGLERLLRVSRSKLIQGRSSRYKVVFIPEVDVSQAARTLLEAATS